MANTNFLFAQNNVANNYAKTGPVDRFQNVKTQTINVGGTDFYYRKLGENNPGAPVIFLNHLAATMDNCDPRIMDGIARRGYHLLPYKNALLFPKLKATFPWSHMLIAFVMSLIVINDAFRSA